MKTIAQCAKLAIEVQDACNLSGVVRSFAQITETLWDEARKQGHGTDWVNQHPVSKLFADKISSLARVQENLSAYLQAFDECRTLAEQSGEADSAQARQLS